MTDHAIHSDSPRVWCLLGRKAGDNTQVRALANALGWPWEEKRIAARSWELLPHLLLGPTLWGIDRGASSALRAPWPELIITAGRRNEPVARWVQARSGGHTRLVHIGRPWAPLACWDLIVTTPQYFLPQQPNVLHNRLPLHDSAELGERASQDAWEARWAVLPRPRIALLMGGDSGPFVFTAEKGARLGALASRLAARRGGSLLLSDSARTPQAAGDAAQAAIEVPAYCYRSASGQGTLAAAEGAATERRDGNPYRAMLAVADAFVVTGDSMSMLAEARDRARPLWIFDPGDAAPWWRQASAWRFKPLSHHLAMALGPRRMRRDVGRIQRALIDAGEARWLGEQGLEEDFSLSAATAGEESRGELRRAAQAVRRLLATADGP